MQPEIHNLLNDVWNDFDHADAWWQLGVLALCLFVAVLADRFVRQKQPQMHPTLSHRLPQGGLRRLVFPLAALVMVSLARAVLAAWYPVNLLSLAIPLLSSLAVIRAVFYVLRYSFNPSGWVAGLERTVALLVWGIVALHIVGLLPGVIELLESITFSIGKQRLNLWLVLQGIVMVVLTLLGALWLSGVIDARLMRAQSMDTNLRMVLSRVAKSLLVTLAVLVALPLVGLDLTTLSVFSGALGVGLGFGLQKIASNYVAGFIILLDRSIRIGNTISVGGVRGKVARITTRYTLLHNAGGNEIIVPNEMIIGSTVASEPLTGSRVKVTLRVRITYASDLERALQLLTDAASARREVLSDPAPSATAVEFTDVGIFLELAFWIVEPESGGWGGLRSDIAVAVWKSFREAGLELH